MISPESIWVNEYKSLDVERRLLIEEGFKLRSDLPRLKMTFPFDWESDPFNDQNWRRQVHMLRMLDPLMWFAWDKCTKEEKEFVCNVVEDWMSWSKSRFSKKSVKAHISWRDHVVGVRLCKLSYLYQWSEPYLNSSNIREEIHKHAEFITQRVKFVDNNHGIYDLHGVSSAVQALGGGECDKYIKFIDENIEVLWDGQFNKHGMHRENSPSYHALGLKLLEKFLKSGFYKRYGFLEKKYKEAKKSFMLQCWPDGRALPLGDTDSKEKNSRALLKDSRLGVFSNDGRLIYRYWYMGEVCQIVFNCSSHGRSHKHSDNLSLLWSEKNDILIDGGKYRFDPGKDRDYFISSHAHNVPVFPDNLSHKAIAAGFGDVLKDINLFRGGFIASGGYYDEYRKIIVKRAVFFEENSGLYWVDIVGEGGGKFSENFLFSDSCSIDESSSKTDLKVTEIKINDSKSVLLSVHGYKGGFNQLVRLNAVSGMDGKVVRGWFSPSYRKKKPCLSAISDSLDGVALVSIRRSDAISSPKVTLGDGHVCFHLKKCEYKVSLDM